MPVSEAKRQKGSMAYHSGHAAENSVERRYCDAGYALEVRRWRGRGGEIDLIFRAGDLLIFVEVKKSSSFAQAAMRVSVAQQRRIFSAASEFVAGQPDGQLTEMRFDVALCDSKGDVKVIENALFYD